MKQRIISGLVGLPLVIFVIAYGGNTLLWTLTIVSIIGLYEIYNAFKIEIRSLRMVGYVLSIIYFFLIGYEYREYLDIVLILFILIVLIAYVFNFKKIHINEIAKVVFGFIYVTYLISHIYLVRGNPNEGQWLVWLIFISAWGSDTFAYFTGVTIGKNKLVPSLSPKKTIEGLIGGIVGAIILCAVYAYILVLTNNLESSKIIIYALIGGAGSVLSVFGDLVASAMKRNLEIKDFGKIMPGHGGILDRFDSILFTGPFVYFISRIIL